MEHIVHVGHVAHAPAREVPVEAVAFEEHAAHAGDLADVPAHDVPVEGVRPEAGGRYIIDGWVTLRDLNRELEWNLPDEEATTIAGLVIHEARTIPTPGQTFSFHGFTFEVMRRQRNQVTTLRVTPPAKSDEL